MLPLVIRFASEIFGRVAMFMVRDGTAVGMAQNGFAETGGPDDAALRSIQIDTAGSSWVTAVLERGKPVQGPPGNEGDRALALALGDTVPGEAYLAPIESTGQVIALLYADNLPQNTAISDTSALEVVLHHAGLALDRAALERALREDANGSPSPPERAPRSLAGLLRACPTPFPAPYAPGGEPARERVKSPGFLKNPDSCAR